MIYSQKEFLLFNMLQNVALKRCFFYKRLLFNYNYAAIVDYWSKDRQKELLVYKTHLFFSFFNVSPIFKYRTSALTFRNNYKPSSYVLANDMRFLLNIRHFMFYGIFYKKALYKALPVGIIYLDLSDYVKSNYIDFYYFNVALRIVFSASVEAFIIKSLFRI